jgi:hypothetical protein
MAQQDVPASVPCTWDYVKVWTTWYARKNAWRVKYLAMDYEDLISEGWLCYDHCVVHYTTDYVSNHPMAKKNPIKNVKDKALFFYLYQRTLINHVTNLANKNTKRGHVRCVKNFAALDTRTVANLGETLVQIKQMTVGDIYRFCLAAGIAPLEFIRDISTVRHPVKKVI